MDTRNLPSNNSESANLPTSLLVSQEQLTAAITRFGDDYTSMVFTKYKLPPANIQKAAESTSPTLHDVTDFFSREATLMWLRFHIAETFAFLGIYDTASKGQIMQTAELVLDHEVFGQMNLEEFLTFLKYFKRGDYGKIYQSARPNPQEFLACLRPFWHDLVEHRIALSKREEEARALEESKSPNNITYEEWCDIKAQCEMIERMYEMHF